MHTSPRWTVRGRRFDLGCRCALLPIAALLGFGLLGSARAALALPHPEPNPPHLEPPAWAELPLRSAAAGVSAAPTLEWLLHESADGLHPSDGEQEMVWLMNRARQDPVEEGLWLATSTDPDIASGRGFFSVNLSLLQSEFAALPAQPPAAFDSRLYEAARLHSLDLIARDAQDHIGQFDRFVPAGFHHFGASGSVFSFSQSALNAHAALNIDWGGTDGTGMQTGRGHRAAIMENYQNVGIAIVPESNPATGVGPEVFTGNYATAHTSFSDHHNRFLVGTVWEDLDGNDRYGTGEGIAGVTVTPDHGTYFAVTGISGGYAIPILASGSYQVTLSGANIGTPIVQNVSFGIGSELLDVIPSMVPEPALPAQQLLALAAVGVLGARRSRRAVR